MVPLQHREGSDGGAIIALDLVDTVYLMSILTDHPRSIDRYIDYFGSGTSDLEPRSTSLGDTPHR
jgi:hypothetical protein